MPVNKTSQNIDHRKNGIEYSFIEVTYVDITQYEIQLYGDVNFIKKYTNAL
jgi:hypothetical protein